MLRNKKLVIIAVSISAALILLTGCTPAAQAPAQQTAGSGISAADLQKVQQLADEAQQKIDSLEGKLADSESRVTSLQNQLSELAADTEIVGATPSETAANIIRIYHETHTYSKTDLFVCADMAIDVWNQLKAQGINAVVQIGNVDKNITQMQDSDHAWVLADVAPGEKLALETTNGQVVPRSQNPLYYTGWSFDSPAKYKRFEELKYEYNLRAVLHNELIDKAEVVFASYSKELDEFNNEFASKPLSQDTLDKLSTVKELEGEYNRLSAAIVEQETALDAIVPEMNSLPIN